MPGKFSNVGGYRALDAVIGRTTLASRNTYLALLTAAPNDFTTLATMVELTTPGSVGYARQLVLWAQLPNDPAQVGNNADVTFGTFSVDFPLVTHCALVSASTGTTGDFLAYWTLGSPVNPGIPDGVRFQIGFLTLSVD